MWTVDTTPPSITCPSDVSVTIPDVMTCVCDVTLSSPVVSDNCGATTVTNNASSCFNAGTNLVIWTATDGCGNSASCTQQVIVAQVAVDDSTLRILTVEAIGDDVNLVWSTFGNSTNIIQLANTSISGVSTSIVFDFDGGTNVIYTGLIGGGYTNSFSDIGTVTVPGTGPVITNWVDYGGATNFPGRFWRIRFVPGPPCPQ